MIATDMERFVDFGKDFIGKRATLRAKQDGPPSKSVYLSVAATDHDCYGNEPVCHGDRIVGLTAGDAYGHAVNRSLALAYVKSARARPGVQFEILMMDNRYATTVLAGAAWDPDNTRLKG